MSDRQPPYHSHDDDYEMGGAERENLLCLAAKLADCIRHQVDMEDGEARQMAEHIGVLVMSAIQPHMPSDWKIRVSQERATGLPLTRKR